MVYAMGLFMTLMAELKEMLSFWTNDYTVDDSELCETFGVQATPPEVALKAYVDFYKTKNKESRRNTMQGIVVAKE
jgi:hypothetical protein